MGLDHFNLDERVRVNHIIPALVKSQEGPIIRPSIVKHTLGLLKPAGWLVLPGFSVSLSLAKLIFSWFSAALPA